MTCDVTTAATMADGEWLPPAAGLVKDDGVENRDK